MSQYISNQWSKTWDMSNQILNPGETGHSAVFQDGDDFVTGSIYPDIIHLNGGNDFAFGGNGDDIILAGAGNDFIYGEGGADLLVGGAGNDTLDGGSGADYLRGGQGNDIYYHTISPGNGTDIINDDMGPSSDLGNGGGVDRLIIQNVKGADLVLVQSGYDLVVTTNQDLADGVLDQGVIIQGQFNNTNAIIEYVVGSDFVGYYFG
ncbi:Hemolysin-type calcium-binding repeat-containing protein [Azospirillum sp. RU38E]|nr:Hemolysin-type calcium-binding repeat-containing protein [Azospirillum sp. RU38E]SNT21460.1 Hemolysin-type calcium-binding repeat-containing protein [Azospirillum sp. RU37A]